MDKDIWGIVQDNLRHQIVDDESARQKRKQVKKALKKMGISKTSALRDRFTQKRLQEVQKKRTPAVKVIETDFSVKNIAPLGADSEAADIPLVVLDSFVGREQPPEIVSRENFGERHAD